MIPFKTSSEMPEQTAKGLSTQGVEHDQCPAPADDCGDPIFG